MSRVEDIFTAKRAITDIKKICSHYNLCEECPLDETGVCDDFIPTKWNTFSLFKETRD